jgi:GPH family glycoside/pentoside/hexuronide:cation symporter
VSQTERPLTLAQKLVYSAPTFAGAAVAIPILIHMPKFYSDTVLVPVGYIAIAIAVARALDAIIDPAIGWLSDRTETRLGRRRPYLLVGAPLCAVSLYFLFTPAAGLEPSRAGVWFGVAFALYFFFHAVYEIPYLGLGAELTRDYHERTSLFGWRTGFLILGTMVASILPPMLEPSLGPRGAMSAIGALFGGTLVVLYLVLTVSIRERKVVVRHTPSALVPGVRVALRNRPFMILLVTFVVASLPSAIPALLLPFYTDYVIDPENTQKTLAMFLGLYFGCGFLFVPLWVWAAKRFGKLPTWLASFGVGISAGIGLFFAGKGDVTWVALLHVWAGLSFSAGFLLVPAMQADVIDYDELYTGQRREAQFTAFWAMVPKFVAIPGAALPIAVLAMIGYVPNQDQTPQVLLGIRAIYALVPAAFGAAAFFLARLYPIDEQTHSAIRAGVEAHARGESATDPLNGKLVPPPSARAVDPETSWFLDHFSPGELRSVVTRGAAGLRARIALKAAACAVLAVAALAVCLATIGDLGRQPGLTAVFSVVGGGFALTGACFHALRLGPARQLASHPIDPEKIRAHLEHSRRATSEEKSAAELLRRAS